MKTKLPAGEYYVGDPCYVIEDWDSFLGPFWDCKPRGGIFDFDGHDCAAFYTHYGDGQYECTDGSLLGVDAGMIGCIPMVLVTTGHPESDGTVIKFKTEFKCHLDYDGRIHFGNVEIMTGDETEECPECGCQV